MWSLIEHQPLRYVLSTREHALCIRIRPSIWQALLPILCGDAPFKKYFKETAGLDFINPTTAPWGFGPILQAGEATPEWVEWVCPLPQVRHGLEREWRLADATVHTLSILFSVLQHEEFPKDPNERLVQLLTVALYRTDRPLGNFPIGGRFSPTAIAWLRRRQERSGTEDDPTAEILASTMYQSFVFMSGLACNAYEFTVELDQPHRLYLGCPGNACDLCGIFDPHWPDSSGEFDCHNVDGPAQQLCFLMALAKLHELMMLSFVPPLIPDHKG